MADEDTKIKDLKTEDPKTEPKAVELKKVEPEKDDKPALHAVVKEVEPKTTVASSVEALVHNLALEFKAVAHDGAAAVEKMADDVADSAEALVDAVTKNVETPAADSAKSAPRAARPGMNYGDPAPAPVGEYAVSPLNDAAAAAVDQGIPVEQANSMTAPGSNI